MNLQKILDSAIYPYYFETYTDKLRDKIIVSIKKKLSEIPGINKVEVLTRADSDKNTMVLIVGIEWLDKSIQVVYPDMGPIR